MAAVRKTAVPPTTEQAPGAINTEGHRSSAATTNIVAFPGVSASPGPRRVPSWRSKKFSFFASHRDTVPSQAITPLDLMRLITDPLSRHAAIVDAVRADAVPHRSPHKAKLPAVTVCGVSRRQKGVEGLRQFTSLTGFWVVDIDSVTNAADVRDRLRGDPYVIAAFVSPSGMGVKVLVSIADAQQYQGCFRTIVRYFQERHNLDVDQSCKDITRLMYLSTDPDAYVADGEVVPFQPAVEAAFPTPQRTPACSVGNIPTGQRNTTLTQFAGSLRRQGLEETEIAAVLLKRNATRCNPPLDDEEVFRIAASIGGYAPGEASNAWPEPQPLEVGKPPVPAFDLALLPEAFRAHVEDLAQRMHAPPDFAAVSYMSIAGALIGSQVGVRPKSMDDWYEYPNLWAAIIAPPSAMKTPCISEPLDCLRQLEHEAMETYTAAMAEYEIDLAAYEAFQQARVKAAKDQAKRATPDNTANVQAALREAMRPTDDPPEPPPRVRYQTNDATIEKLGELLVDNPRGLLVFRDELMGLMRGMDRDGHEQDRAFYLEAFNGKGSFAVDRIGRGEIQVPRLILSVLGGIQPGPFVAYLGEAARGGQMDDGMVQRFQLAIWPDVPTDFTLVDRYPKSRAKDAARTALRQMVDLDLGALRTEEDEGRHFLRFDQMAQAVFNGWYTRHMRRTRQGEMPDILKNHLGKYPKTVSSLALISHLVDGGTGRITAPHVRRAIAWITYLEAHAQRIYQVALRTDGEAAAVLGRHLRAGDLVDGFTARDVVQRGWTSLGQRGQVEGALAVLVDLGWLRVDVPPAGPGRPTSRYRINPGLRTMPPGPTTADSTVQAQP
jgi:hypothetical protein